MIEGINQTLQIIMYIGTVAGALLSIIGLYFAVKKWVKFVGHCCLTNGCADKLADKISIKLKRRKK